MENNIKDRELTLQSEVIQAIKSNKPFKFNLEDLDIEMDTSVELEKLTNNTTLTRLILTLNGEKGDIKYGHCLKDLLIKHPTLQVLHLDTDVLDTKSSQYFSEGLRRNTTLTELTMYWVCDDDDDVESMRIFMESFKHNTTLKKLKMAFHSALTLQETSPICDSLVHNTSLTSLNIIGAFVHGPSLQKLMEVNRTITELDLEYYGGLSTVLNHILQTNRSLKSLVLRFNGNLIDASYLNGLKANQTLTKLDLGMPISGNFIEVTAVLREAKSLRELKFDKLTDYQASILAEYIEQTTTLKKIDLCVDAIYESLTIFSHAMSTNKSITSAVIRNTHYFYDRRECCLMPALMNNSTLTDLQLINTGIDDTSMNILTTSLSTNKTLLKLKISVVDSRNVVDFFKSLLKNDTLKSLAIRNGDIYDRGCNQLMKVIEMNTTLEELNIKGGVYQEHLPQLCKALKRNNSLRKLILNFNASRDMVGTIDRLKDVFSVNTTLTELRIGDEKIDYAIRSALEVNRKRFKDIKYSSVVLLYNIVRDKDTRLKLPLELWKQIFVQLKYSGIDHFDALVKRILR